MSQKITFSELVNLAIGTPELGNVNFNALHFLLHSMLEHFKLQDVQKEISEDELDFLKPPPKSSNTGVASEPVPATRRSSSIFHQMHERIVCIERKLSFLNDSPNTAELLTRTQAGTVAQPAQDMWQLIQLKKKMEMNEEGMSKAMNTLQDLLGNICALKASTENLKGDLGNMKNTFQKLDVENLQQQLLILEEHAKAVDEIRQNMGSMMTTSMPGFADFVQWSTLCEMLLGKSFPEMDREDRDRLSREMFSALGRLPEKHLELTSQIAQLEGQLKSQAEQLERYEATAEPEDLTTVLKRMITEEKQEQETLRGMQDQMSKLREQCEKQGNAVDRLKRNSTDIQNIHNLLEQLNITKADKALLEEEMNVKADKSALEAKVNHVDLALATSQLSEMMQDLLQKMSLQDKDWQAALERLFSDMDLKLDRMALDPLNKQLEDVWQLVKQYLSEGPRFDADSAAGFKKQLFERVKCISCDRPVTLMTGPHLITIRKAPLRPRPASANGYEYLAQKQKKELETTEAPSNQPPQTCWQCQAHQTCTIKRLSRSQDFTTMYPYGDPTVLTYDNAEVDILGVNGVLYKGRVNAQAAERALAVQKRFLGEVLTEPLCRFEDLVTECAREAPGPSSSTPRQRIYLAGGTAPRPPSGLRMERVRSAIVSGNYVSPYASSAIQRIRSAMATSRPMPPGTPETMDGVFRRNASLSQHSLQSGGGVKGV